MSNEGDKSEFETKKRKFQNFEYGELYRCLLTNTLLVKKIRLGEIDDSKLEPIMDKLPDEVLRHIFGFLDKSSLLNACLVNTRFKEIISQTSSIMIKMPIYVKNLKQSKEFVNAERKYQEMVFKKYLKPDLNDIKQEIAKEIKVLTLSGKNLIDLETFLKEFPKCENLSINNAYNTSLSKDNMSLKLPNLKILKMKTTPSDSRKFERYVQITSYDFSNYQLTELVIRSSIHFNLAQDFVKFVLLQKSLKRLTLEFVNYSRGHFNDINMTSIISGSTKCEVEFLEIKFVGMQNAIPRSRAWKSEELKWFCEFFKMIKPTKQCKVEPIYFEEEEMCEIFSNYGVDFIAGFPNHFTYKKLAMQHSNADIIELCFSFPTNYNCFNIKFQNYTGFFERYDDITDLKFINNSFDDSKFMVQQLTNALKHIELLKSLKHIHINRNFPTQFLDEKYQSMIKYID